MVFYVPVENVSTRLTFTNLSSDTPGLVYTTTALSANLTVGLDDPCGMQY